jgi:integrase
MKQKITKQAVEGLRPHGRQKVIWDTEIRGFGVRCRPSGAKHYVIKFRSGGRQRWITIGRHGSPWTPTTARTEALRQLGLKAAGRDPASERDRQKGIISVAELGERFLHDYVPRHLKQSTGAEYRRAVELFINPDLGHHRISDLTRSDIGGFHSRLAKIPYQANRALGVLSKMMNLAEEWGLRADGTNPCRHVKKYREQKRERYLSIEELQRLGQTLTEVQKRKSEDQYVLAALGLLILTGARLGEILSLKWDYVDFAQGILRLPESKTGAKAIFLNTSAAELLRAIPRLDQNPYVIAGKNPDAHLVELQKPWRRIRSEAGLKDVRIHDLRHSFAAMAAGAGMSLPMIGKLLGHSQPATTARYAHLAADPMREAAELVGAKIAAAINTDT